MLRPDGRASARKSFVLMVMGTVMFFLCSISSADVPDSINYQGKLTTASGGCLNDTVQMIFTIYADESGTMSEWSETQTQVEVKEGIFNVLLGSVSPLPALIFDGSAKYLGIQVESDPEMTPLKPMVTTAYAFHCATADSALNAPAAGIVSVDGVSNPGGDVDFIQNNSITITPNDGANTVTFGETHSARTDNPHAVAAAQTNALVSVDGVSNAGGNVDFVAGSNMTITPNDGANTVTFASTAGGIGGSGTANYIPKFTASTTLGNSAISQSGSNVGIGTTSPGYKLHVNGNFFGNTVNTGQGNNELYAMNQNVRTSDNPTFNRVDLSDYGTALGGFHVGGTSDPGTDNLIVDGNVGIGTTNPGQNLQIDENSETGPEIRLMSQKDGDDGDKHGIIRFRGRNGEGQPRDVSAFWSENHGDPYWLTNWQGRLSFGVRYRTLSVNYPPLENPILSIMAGDHYDQYRGRVGIMTTTPSYELDVAGTAQMTSFKMPTGASSGKVLTSDASGGGTWQAPPGGIGGSGTTNYIPKFTASTTLGNSAIYQSGSNVGIGTTSPGYKLHVNGNFYGTTVNTGQGDNELYAMNQNVRTTDNVTFNRVALSDYGTALGGFHVGGTSDPGTDNLVVDGSIGVANDLNVHGLAGFDQYLYHFGDPDTYILFTDDQMTLYSGSVNLIRALEGTQDQVVINEDGVDVDFRVESDLDVNAFFVRGSDSNVGIGDATPDEKFDVNGDVTIYGGLAVDDADGTLAPGPGQVSAEGYGYRVAQTRHYAIAPADFTTFTPDQDDVSINVVNARVDSAPHLTTFLTSLHLPHNAVIKDVCVYGSANTEGWILYRKDIVDEDVTPLTSANLGSGYCSTGNTITVDNDDYVYVIMVQGLDAGEKIYGGSVKYTVTVPLP